jgi:hypothetical protein
MLKQNENKADKMNSSMQERNECGKSFVMKDQATKEIKICRTFPSLFPAFSSIFLRFSLLH